VLADIEAEAIAYTENDAPVVITSTITIADADHTTLTSAMVTIDNFVSDQDVLTFANSAEITGSFDAVTGSLTLSGNATLAQYQAAIRSITYHNTSNNPNTALRTVQITVNDGNLNSNTTTRNITVNSINNQPTLSNISKSGQEDQSIAFTQADFEAAFADVDGTMQLIRIVTLPLNGTLQLSGVNTTAGSNILPGQLNSLTFTPNLNWNGTTSFQWNGSDGQQFATTDAVVNISVTPVNDAPTVNSFSVSGNEDTRIYITQTLFNQNFSDVDEGNTLSKIIFTELPSSGLLKLINTPIVANQEIAYTDIANLNFHPDINWHGSTTCRYKGSDGWLFADNDAQITIIVSSVNDIPEISDINKNGTEDTPLTFTTADFEDAFADIDGTLIKIRINTLPLNGS
jgi:hypothetical protein